MQWRSALGLGLASLLLLITGGPVSFAETDVRYPMLESYRQGGYASRQRPSTRYETSQAQPYRYGRPAETRTYYYYDPRSGSRQVYDPRTAGRPAYDPRQAAPAQPAYRSIFPFFSSPSEPPAYAEPRREVTPRREVRRSYEAPQRRVRRVVPAAPKVGKPEEPEVEPSTYVVVFGDSLAELLGQGLETALEDNEDVGVVRKTRGDSGLVRTEIHDWPKTIQEFLASGQKINVAVVMFGANDRQAIREGETAHEPLSDRWKELYRQRVDDVIRIFAERRIPLLWVGAPPMKNDRVSADLMAMNEIYRERVQRAGAVYVDIWQGFVDDQNRYAATGPDVEGQVVRLRTGDGVHFTRAGARKAAHFADVELKRLMEQRGPAMATPTPGQAPPKDTDIERLISASLPALPEPQGLPSLPQKPIAGPVIPLTRPETSPGGALISGRPRLDGDAYLVDRALREGIAPPPRPGRADDFKWPRS